MRVVSDLQREQWLANGLGSIAGNEANGLYISNDAGVTNAYTINSTSVVHAYRDIAVPAGTTTVEFDFDWKAVGRNKISTI